MADATTRVAVSARLPSRFPESKEGHQIGEIPRHSWVETWIVLFNGKTSLPTDLNRGNLDERDLIPPRP